MTRNLSSQFATGGSSSKDKREAFGKRLLIFGGENVSLMSKESQQSCRFVIEPRKYRFDGLIDLPIGKRDGKISVLSPLSIGR